jgi:hypothetical protein
LAVERFNKAASLSKEPTYFNFDLALSLFGMVEYDAAIQAVRARLNAFSIPPDLKEMLPEFEELALRHPDSPGLSDVTDLLRSRLSTTDN